MKIIKGKPRYEQTFFRFLEYFAQVKTVSLKRAVIASITFKTWVDFNIKKLGKKQVEILIELWNKR